MTEDNRSGYRADQFFRLPVRLSKRDLETLEREANGRGYVVGYYLDVILADKAMELRRARGEMECPSEIYAANDPWRKARPS